MPCSASGRACTHHIDVSSQEKPEGKTMMPETFASACWQHTHQSKRAARKQQRNASTYAATDTVSCSHEVEHTGPGGDRLRLRARRDAARAGRAPARGGTSSSAPAAGGASAPLPMRRKPMISRRSSSSARNMARNCARAPGQPAGALRPACARTCRSIAGHASVVRLGCVSVRGAHAGHDLTRGCGR